MTTNPPDMKVRISAALRQRIEDAAKRNNRTMNGEIVARLEKSFEPTRPELSALTEDDYDYIAGKVLARLQRGEV
jgi:hypothetical protein